MSRENKESSPENQKPITQVDPERAFRELQRWLPIDNQSRSLTPYPRINWENLVSTPIYDKDGKFLYNLLTDPEPEDPKKESR